ncbi:MAG: hypothetical protein LAP61_21035 [Acidobacteriia bacterium]|nr:hypothetical protein [Terriglobia bacterium]
MRTIILVALVVMICLRGLTIWGRRRGKDTRGRIEIDSQSPEQPHPSAGQNGADAVERD